MLAPEALDQPLAGAKVLCTLASAGQDDRLVLVVRNIREKRVRRDGDAMRTLDLPIVGYRSRDDPDAATTENIYDADRLDLFKTLCQRNKNLSHCLHP